MIERRADFAWALGLVGFTLLSGCGGDEVDETEGGGASGGSSGASGFAGAGAIGGSDTGGTSGRGGASGSAGTSATGGSAGSAATGGSGGTSGSGTGGSTPSGDFPADFGPVEPILTGLSRPVRLALRDGYLYFTEMGFQDGSMSRLARRSATGEVETLFSGNTVAAMHLAATELFFVERGTLTVYRMSYETLEPVVFTTTTMIVGDVETLADAVWFTEFTTSPQTTAVSMYSLSGALLAQPVPTTPNMLFAYLVVGGGNVYISSLAGTQALFKASSSGSGGVTVSNVQPAHLAANDTHVYFTSQNDGRVLRQLHTLDERPEQLASGQAGPFAVAVDGGGVYWTNGGGDCEGMATGGSVYGAPLEAGIPVPIATGERCPQAIATDGEYVYWTRDAALMGQADDSIVRARKILR